MMQRLLWKDLLGELGGIIPVCKLNDVRCHFLCTVCVIQPRQAQPKEHKAISTSSKPSHSMFPGFSHLASFKLSAGPVINLFNK